MKVDVENGLARTPIAIQNSSVPTFSVAMLLRECNRAPDHRTHESIVAGSQIVQRGNVPARDDQEVKGRLWIDVLEGDDIAILMDEVAGDFASDDLAEQAVAHRR
jgi:hypothetical protein